MGSIYKRGEVFWIKYYRYGKPHRESAKSDKESEAKRLLKRREGEIAEGKIPTIYFDRIRFEQLAEDFLTDYRINDKKSLVRAERSVNHLKQAFERCRITDITTPRIKAYIQKRIDEGMENGTINRELAALKRIMNLGAEQTPPKVDKIPHIPMLQENNVRKGFFEHGDFLALREALPDYLKGFVTFAYKTGWRVSEIENLTWSQVDLDNGVVRLDVGSTKNNEGRTVYIDQELISVLTTLREKRKEQKKILPWVFTNKSGTDRIKEFRKSWEKGCEDAEIGKRLFHDFRRTAVRNMVRAGVPERVVMMVSGHKTRNIFERYNIVSDTDLKLAAQKQETYLQAQMGTVSGTVTQIEKKKGQTSEI